MATCFRMFHSLALIYVQLSSVTQGQECYSSITLMGKFFPEEDFESVMRRSYRSVTSRSRCVHECMSDETCTEVMLCNEGCYLLGVFIANLSTTENSASCRLFLMDRCKNGGQPEDSGYCNCPFGFGGRYCEMNIDDKCYNRWRAVYDTESSESKNDLINQTVKKCRGMLKTAFNGRVHNVGRYSLKKNEVWAQTTPQLTKTSWDSFGTTPQRRFESARSNRCTATMKYTIDGTSVSTSTSTSAVKWFVKQHTSEVPDFVSNSNASATDYEIFLEKVKNGAADSFFGTFFVSSDESLIAAERLDDISQNHNATTDAFSPPAYWKLVKVATSTNYSYIKWNVGVATLNSRGSKEALHVWCTDDCWRKVLTVEVNGSVSFGSVLDTASSILNGHGVRVYFNGIAAKTNTIHIHNHTVTALLHDIMEPLDVNIFPSSGTAYTIMTSTSGAVTMRGYTYESGTIVSETEEVHSVQWYTDTRQWIKVLVVKGDGTKRYGSVTELKNFVMEAASVRLVVEYTSGMRQAMDVDHLEIAADGNVAADIINHSAVHNDGSKLSFDSATSYHRWSAIITTHGHFQKYHYTFQRSDGITEQVGDVFTFSWFIQQ